MFEKIISALESLWKGQLSTMQVATELDKLAAESSDRLDWRNSIVDLLKALKLDSSPSARTTLWQEMGHTDAYAGSADQNVALHRDVVNKVAARGIKLVSSDGKTL